MRLLVGLFVVLWAAACGSRSATKQLPTGQMIAIGATVAGTIGTDTVRFGHMHEGECAVLPLLLRNDTAHPLVIRSVERSCGCTSLDYENQPIMPGQLLPVRLAFDSRGVWGWQLKGVKIHFAGLAAPHRIVVEAEVE